MIHVIFISRSLPLEYDHRTLIGVVVMDSERSKDGMFVGEVILNELAAYHYFGWNG